MTEYLLFILCVCASFWASGSESAFISLSRVQLHAWLQSGKLRYRAVLFLMRHLDVLVTSLLCVNNFVMVWSTIFFMRILQGYGFSVSEQVLYTMLVFTPIYLFVGEILPKFLFRYFGSGIIDRLAYVYVVFYWLLYPVQWLFLSLAKCLVPGGRRSKLHDMTREDFEALIKVSEQEGALETQERLLITNILRLGKRTAGSRMRPLRDMTACDVQTEPKVALSLLMSERNPDGLVLQKDNAFIGHLHRKDGLLIARGNTLVGVSRTIPRVRANQTLDRVLLIMQRSRTQLLLVENDRGLEQGFLTVTDLIHAIVAM